MTKENFLELMTKKDELRENEEYLAGVENAVMDGDTYEQHGEVEVELKQSLAYIDYENAKLCRDLGVPRRFFDEVLDSCVVNRWELYRSIVLHEVA